MRDRHLILMLLKASGGSIASKTKIHKEVYFLSLILDEDFGFQAHYYGPYSPNVEQGLDELMGAGFVEKESTVFGINKNQGFEYKRYDFSLTKSGEKLAEELLGEHPEYYRKIENFIKTLDELGGPDYLSLSIAAKAFYIIDRIGETMNAAQISEKANDFGWRIKRRDINRAIKILDHLCLTESVS